MNTTQHVRLYTDTPEIRDSIVVTCLISNIPPENIMAALQFNMADVMIQQATGVPILPDWFNDCVDQAIKILEDNKQP